MPESIVISNISWTVVLHMYMQLWIWHKYIMLTYAPEYLLVHGIVNFLITPRRHPVTQSDFDG